MCCTMRFFAVVLVIVFMSFVETAPASHYHSRGPYYTVSNANAKSQPFIEVRNATYHGAGPREEARAMCSVRTQEVNATANATITRRLHGVVTTREFHNAIQRLEVIIFGQMQQLWQSLDALRSNIAGIYVPRTPTGEQSHSDINLVFNNFVTIDQYNM